MEFRTYPFKLYLLLVFMESIILHQHILGFSRMEYIIEKDGLRIKKMGPGSSSDQKVEYEDIGTKITSAHSSFLIWFYIGVFFIFLSVVSIFLFSAFAFPACISGLLFFLLFINSRKNKIILAQPDHTSYIEFTHIAKEKILLEAFIGKLIERRNVFFKEKYMKLDSLLPFNQQYGNLIWLYELQLITRDELQKKIVELESMGIPLDGIERPGDRIHITGFTKRKDDDVKH